MRPHLAYSALPKTATPTRRVRPFDTGLRAHSAEQQGHRRCTAISFVDGSLKSFAAILMASLSSTGTNSPTHSRGLQSSGSVSGVTRSHARLLRSGF
jgi:hypothetical protein